MTGSESRSGSDSGGPCKNTDRELFRETPGDYYADSLHVTESGSIGINVGGTVYVRPLREWHAAMAKSSEIGVRISPDLYRRILEQHELAAEALVDSHGDVHREIVAALKNAAPQEPRSPLKAATSTDSLGEAVGNERRNPASAAPITASSAIEQGTPRTDAVLDVSSWTVSADFARQLERELAETLAKYERLQQSAVGWQEQLAQRSSTTSAEPDAVTAAQVRQQVIKAAYRPKPMCRDCGDRDGTCYDGTKCDPFEAALDMLRAHANRSTGRSQ